VLQVAQAVFREGEQWAMGGFAPMKALAQLWSQQIYVFFYRTGGAEEPLLKKI
jgi:hypothetical protein